MNAAKRLLMAGLVLMCSSPVLAVIINFQEMADTGSSSVYQGEKGFSTLSLLGLFGIDVDITALDTSNTASTAGSNGYHATAGRGWAYLDSGTAGLGACTRLTSSAQCNPSSDDNVSPGETLRFTFNEDVLIDNIVFNNNHDSDYFLAGNYIDIGSDSYLFSSTDVLDPSSNSNGDRDYTYSFTSITGLFSAGSTLDIKLGSTNADQFYLTAMDITGVSVLEPLSLVLLGLGLIGLGSIRRKPVL